MKPEKCTTLTEPSEDVKHAGVSGAHRLNVGEVVMHIVNAVACQKSVGRRRLPPVDSHAGVCDFLETHFQRLAWHWKRDGKFVNFASLS